MGDDKTNSKKLKTKLADLPVSAGVYIFKDIQGKIIYIGKAKSLKKRVHSYFNRPQDTKTQVLVSKIAAIEYRLTPSEAQAHIQEAALIKENQPQYNIDLKDDKSFPWIRITDEEFPLVSILRRKKRQKHDRSLYFGPYTSAKLLRRAFKLMRRIFGFRSCKKMPKQACLYFRLQLCPAPCLGKISRRDYQASIHQIKLFLEFKYEELIQELTKKMQQAAKEKKFEQAAKIRDRLGALSVIAQTKCGFTSIDELDNLRDLLKLNRLPERIEAFDISNTSGKEATGAMVSFLRGSADKNNYRRFRIKTVESIDDYKMLSEVVSRRYSRVIEEKLPLPDLVLIDGGRAHLLTAEKTIEKLGIRIPLVSIAKEKDNIYVADRRTPIKLKSDTPALNLIRRIRDEAHRFAISYHHLLHRKKVIGK